ncbi:MAG: hypothetical protein ACREPQ_14390 [Rhodanobacter sp.]
MTIESAMARSAFSDASEPATVMDSHATCAPRAPQANPKGPRSGRNGRRGKRGREKNFAERQRVRFVYYVAGDIAVHERYHDYLVTAEILLDRALQAHADGRRPINAAMTIIAERSLRVRPARGQYEFASADYLRWYDNNGMSRVSPLTLEDLVDEVVAVQGCSRREAMVQASRSRALPAVDQHWLEDRARSPIQTKPLHGRELRQLVAAIESAFKVPDTSEPGPLSNRNIAVKAAATLAGLLDDYTKSPFQIPVLDVAYRQEHAMCLDHLANVARLREDQIRLGRTTAAAKAQAKQLRKHAEHQAVLATLANAPNGLSMVAKALGKRLRPKVG